jgi:hypothetical protein
MSSTRVSQAVAYVLSDVGVPTRITQSVVYVLGSEPGEGGGGGGGGETSRCPEAILFGGLKKRTLLMLGENPDSPVYWSNAEIGRHINDAYSDICLETRAIETVEAVALTDDSGYGFLSDRISQVYRASFEDRVLENVTRFELDRLDPQWETHSGLVTHYVSAPQNTRALSLYKTWDGSALYAYNQFVDGEYIYSEWLLGDVYLVNDRVTKGVSATDDNKIAFVCISDHTASSSNEPGVGTDWETYWSPLSLVVWAAKNPVALVDDTDEPELPAWFHIALAFSAAARALRKYGEQRNIPAADVYQAMTDEYVGMLKHRIGNRTPSKMTIASSSSTQSRGFRRPMPWDQTVPES